MERTGDDVCGERRRGGVVAGAGGEALEVGGVVVSAGGVEAKDRRGLDGGDGDVRQGRDATAAYEGRTRETRRGEEGNGWVGVSVEVGGGGVAVAYSDDRRSRSGLVVGGEGGGDGDDNTSGVRERWWLVGV